MREIEVKARLKDMDGFLAAAEKLGITFGDAITQDDTTYENDLPHDDPNWNIFRIRKQGDKQILTMKHKASSRSRDNHEYETAVEDPAQMVKILNRLGYNRGVHLRKQRRIAHYKDLELCLDAIESLGVFVEAEKMVTDQADVDKVQAELWALLQQLGISPDDRVHRGYDTLMRQHLG
jgi:adenylate cyclase class 2